ncbi:hypothetical protein BH23ACT9_BH23ACT9_17620 [soil metagenome]
MNVTTVAAAVMVLPLLFLAFGALFVGLVVGGGDTVEVTPRTGDQLTGIPMPVSRADTDHNRSMPLARPHRRSSGLRTGGPLLTHSGP